MRRSVGFNNRSASVGFFQANDASGNVADPATKDIYDKTAPNVNPNPMDPMSTGQLFHDSTTYRLDLKPDAMVSDTNGASAPIQFPNDAMDNPVTSLCFDTGPVM